MRDGFLLLAMGKPLFGRLAYNLAASIKTSLEGKNYPVYLAHCGEALSSLRQKHYKVFDGLISIPQELSHYKGVMMPFRMKLLLKDITPFENTVYIDADSVLFEEAKISDLFKANYGLGYNVSIGSIIERVGDSFDGSVHIWLDPSNVAYLFPHIERIYVVGSSFMYLERSAYLDALMNTALDLHDRTFDKELNLISVGYRNHIADEPILSLALALHDYKPKFFPYKPLSHPAPFSNFNDREREMRSDTIGLTIPGEPAIRWYISLYNRIVKRSDAKLRNLSSFTWDSSKAFETI